MSSSDEEILLSEVDKSKEDIRKELSAMSFEDLQKLKEKIGLKVYNATIFGTKNIKKSSFKRENKNRPREESAKKQVPRFREVIPVKKKIARDPRFDSLCGEFNENAFKNSYKFLHDLRKNDLERLKSELQCEQDPKQIKKIKFLIQRLGNQIREEEKKQQAAEQEKKEKEDIYSAVKNGEKPTFRKKSEKRITNLISQYEDLKQSGKLKKHIQRLRKKNIAKDRKRLQKSVSESP